MTVPQYAQELGTILGELEEWYEFARRGSAGMYPSIQGTDILHYTKMSILCVHMILHEKYTVNCTIFGGTDEGDFAS